MPDRISAALLLLLSPLAAQDLTLNLPPMADAFVRSGSYSQTSFGLEPLITLQYSSACEDSLRKGLFVFDLSVLEAFDVTSAVLRLEVLPGGVSSNHLWGIVDDDDWDPIDLPESEINYENAPKNLGPLCYAFENPGTKLLQTWTTEAGVQELDVTAYVRWGLGLDPEFAVLPQDADRRLTFLTYDLPSLSTVNIQSKEGAPGTGPSLQIKAVPLPEPAPSHALLAKVPECEDQPFLPPAPQPEDQFGEAVSISGSRAVIGAPLDDDTGYAAGSVCVFERTGAGWGQTAQLVAADAAAGALFGNSVALDGETLAVGADSDHAGAADAGAVYVFALVDSVWTEIAKLSAPDAVESQHFGNSLALQGDTLLVGAHRDSQGGTNAGAVYVFERVAGIWTFAAKLLAADRQAHSLFGSSVALDGATALIGAPEKDRMGALDAGAVYAFERDAGGWQQTAELWPADFEPGDELGNSVALQGDTALAGAWLEDEACSDSSLCNAGAAYVFERSNSLWHQSAKLLPPDPDSGTGFGTSAALTPELAVIGAPWDDHDTAGVDGLGSVQVFERKGAGWVWFRKLVPSDFGGIKHLGHSVSTSAGMVLAGAPESAVGSLGLYAGAARLFGLHLCGDRSELSVSAGGQQRLILSGGAAGAGANYLLLGSASGISPGFMLQGFVVPLNVDPYLLFTLNHPNSAVIPDSLGELDDEGRAAVALKLPAGSPPSLVGALLFHAFAAFDPSTMQIHLVSNPTALKLLP